MQHHDPRRLTGGAEPMRHAGETVDDVLAVIAAHVTASTRSPAAPDPGTPVGLPGHDEQRPPAEWVARDLLVRLTAAIERREQNPIKVTPSLRTAIQRARHFDRTASAELQRLSARAESTGDYRYRDERAADHGELAWEHLRSLLTHLDDVP
ncbi:hypothetical protein [Dactylosporangium sp. CA-139066]|uniref:hypothetical protein n=1 Tax=Dactylosporangium sp. CA-139066 TaxID=3239930 RepID=UPI003D8FBC4B